jgi:bifunctional polynucleotide phosphatase/kinase
MSWHHPSHSLAIYVPANFVSTGHIAGFDLDWTIIRPVRGQFRKDENDLAILPNRKDILRGLIERGFTLSVFTNQKSASNKVKTTNLRRIENFINMIGLPIVVLVSIDDVYRKPLPGMWQILNSMTSVKSRFYCGDAAGRPQDFADSDKMFAENGSNIPVSTDIEVAIHSNSTNVSEIKFYIPEELFPSIEMITLSKDPLISIDKNIVKLPVEKSMVVFVGMPGSGKSTYYHQALEPMGYIHVNQDKLTTMLKVLKTIRESLALNKSIAIDATNPQQSKREKYYDLAKEYGYEVTVLYFVRDGFGWNKLRENPVPRLAYSMYFKNLIEPNPENTPGSVYQIP